ncbi:MAG: hypothetical protein AAB966_00115 [Patescibacteria group bacterium]
MENHSKDLSNIDVVLYALFKLGGILKPIHTEEIAWEAFKLAKERFSWRLTKFRAKGFPDKSPVRFALENAKKEESGRLIEGRAGGDASGELEGWLFTPNGARWIKENEDRIIKLLKQSSMTIPKREAERFIKKIQNDPLYKSYKKNNNLDEASIYMFADMLVCAPDSSKNIIRKKFDQLFSYSILVDSYDIGTFFQACKEKYQDFLT